MSKTDTPNLPSIPHLLSEAVKNQRAVVLLGAGSSMECCDAAGLRPPSGMQLRDLLARKFLGVEVESRDLMTVAELAIAGGAGQPAVFDEIDSMLRNFGPSEAHRLLAEFKWRGLATTNYDTVVEQAYAEVRSRLQDCVPFVKDQEPFDDRLKRHVNPVAYLKLHGCLNHRLDRDIPLVLSHEHYARISENRIYLLQRLQHWASESPLIFIGYNLADSHIRNLVYQIERGARPHWYIVAPNADEHDVRFWATKNVEVISTTFGNFMKALDSAVPKLFRSLSTPISDASYPYRSHFRTNSIESDALKQSLSIDFEYIHAGISIDDVPPEKFYSGHDNGWCGIVRKYDFSRKVGEDLLYKALSTPNDGKLQRFFLLQGAAGSGKSVALKRAAYDAATALGEVSLWLRRNGVLKFNLIEELIELTGKVPIVFVDSISFHSDAVNKLIKEAELKNKAITIIASERQADWGTYCSDLEERYPPEIVHLRHLSEGEVNGLLDLLERHKCLGMLSELSRPDQIASFMNEDRSDRQLLVALHELTQGKPFEEIILGEYNRVSPESARQLYLDIATMHQFGTVARAGAISRVSGIRFTDFENDFFQPLKEIVKVDTDRFTGDKAYSTRHARVAEIVFGQACQTDQAKTTQLVRILEGIDAGFSSDLRILNAVCKGRGLAQRFSAIEFARSIFDTAHRIAPREAHLFQQNAILEYSHKGGSLDRAEALALRAREIDSKNHIYIHTLAEIARRQALEAQTQVRKDHLRSHARGLLGEIRIKDSRRDLSYCKLLVDEVLDFFQGIDEEPKDHQTLAFDQKLAEAAERLQRAQQDFPDEPDVGSTEAHLWKELGENERAAHALSRAIKARPRSAGIYTRLARIHREKGELTECIEILRTASTSFPDDKNTHLQLALALIANEGTPNQDIEQHLRSSFSIGDHNFDGRFYYAEYLFWSGRSDEAQLIFDDLNSRSPPTYRTKAPRQEDEITSRMGQFAGVVSSKKLRFFFIKSGSFSKQVFAHSTSVLNLPFVDLEEGHQVIFKLKFNREGPVASDVYFPEGK